MVVFIFQKEVITMDFRVIGDTYRYGVRVTAIVVRDGKLLTYKVEDPFASYFSATNGDKRDCGVTPYRLWCSDF